MRLSSHTADTRIACHTEPPQFSQRRHGVAGTYRSIHDGDVGKQGALGVGVFVDADLHVPGNLPPSIPAAGSDMPCHGWW